MQYLPKLGCVLFLSLFLGLLESVSSLPHDRFGDDHDRLFARGTHPFADFGHRSVVSRQDKVDDLRILALGASIVFGVGSSNGNG